MNTLCYIQICDLQRWCWKMFKALVGFLFEVGCVLFGTAFKYLKIPDNSRGCLWWWVVIFPTLPRFTHCKLDYNMGAELGKSSPTALRNQSDLVAVAMWPLLPAVPRLVGPSRSTSRSWETETLSWRAAQYLKLWPVNLGDSTIFYIIQHVYITYNIYKYICMPYRYMSLYLAILLYWENRPARRDYQDALVTELEHCWRRGTFQSLPQSCLGWCCVRPKIRALAVLHGVGPQHVYTPHFNGGLWSSSF